MIISLKIKNFYSIKEEQLLDLSVRDNKDDSFGYCNSLEGKISKFSMLVGANASGKTNILRGLSFLQWFISRPDVLVPTNSGFQFPHKSFFGNEDPTNFEVMFEIDKKIYSYFLSLDKAKVIEEKLSVKQEINIKTGTSLIFHRKFNKTSNLYDILPDKIDNVSTKLDIFMRPDIGIVSIGSILNIPQITLLNNYWRNIKTNVNVAGYVGDILPIDIIAISQNQIRRVKIEKILKKFDIGLEELWIDVQTTAPRNFFIRSVKEKHIFEGIKYENDIQDASNGTKRLISVLLRLINAFENGTPVILDELDIFLHPAILEEIVDMFFDEEINAKNAQLFFSSHSHAVMNKLDKYQIVITQKNDKGYTEIKRLDSFGPEVRNDDNFYKKYTTGIYSGIPNL